jgi:hypothetical protein
MRAHPFKKEIQIEIELSFKNKGNNESFETVVPRLGEIGIVV